MAQLVGASCSAGERVVLVCILMVEAGSKAASSDGRDSGRVVGMKSSEMGESGFQSRFQAWSRRMRVPRPLVPGKVNGEETSA
ncbi:Hypothetical predicted protein [Paramuricea clavata]|uniref:Uncharacterized protein n=1 Tax=Paramuricea clavata TaxID=317549 RepID=A0A6S7KLH5_PARCT|nr:Hypothetical predicted protein [Paramuricea clavata]